MTDTEFPVALWWVHYNSPDYELYETEQEAADYGTYLEDDGQGAVLGVQFADGRTIARRDWAAYREAKQRHRDEFARRAAERESAPPVPVRDAKDPFEGLPVKIEEGEPSWLGAP